MKAVVLVGMFPPPIHGMAAVNSFVEQALRERAGRIVAIDLSSGALSTSGRSVVRRVRRVLLGAGRFLGLAGTRRVGALYMGLSGGNGQLYEMLFIVVARIFRITLFLHHHSFAYVDRRSRLAWLTIALAGRSATHVLLCERMRSGIETTYRRPLRAVILSNFAFARAPHAAVSSRAACKTIGFLSNISPEKGIMLFLEIASRIKATGARLKIVIAGPFGNPAVEQLVTARIKEIGGINYRGAVYDQDKQLFFDEIDALVFPSQYVHEAEPVTIIEALTRGIPVVAMERGCLSTLVPSGCGLVVPARADFVETALDQLQVWVRQPEEYRRASQMAARWAENSHGSAIGALSRLCSEISALCGSRNGTAARS